MKENKTQDERVIYPKAAVERWEREFEEVKKDYKAGKLKAYGSVDEMVDELEQKIKGC